MTVAKLDDLVQKAPNDVVHRFASRTEIIEKVMRPLFDVNVLEFAAIGCCLPHGARHSVQPYNRIGCVLLGTMRNPSQPMRTVMNLHM